MISNDVFSQKITEVMSEGVYITDHLGVVMYANPAFTTVTGIDRERVLGRNMQTFLNEMYDNGDYGRLDIDQQNSSSESFTDKPDALCEAVIRQRCTVTYIANLTMHGLNKTILFKGHPIWSAQGELENVLTVMQDLTDLNRLKNELGELEKRHVQHLSELSYLRSIQTQKDFIGESEPIIAIKRLIHRIAETDAVVLITGETGVGKEIVAKELHRISTRSDMPYVKINCAAIPENLMESELFGYERGAFSGADRKGKIGYFEMANHGTLLLDEIGEMPMHLQSKLLRVIQDGEVTRVGGTEVQKLDIRFIASTNQPLQEKIERGAFRADLYYRLNVIPIEVPPVRTRAEDIPLLVSFFLDKLNAKYNRTVDFSPKIMEIMQHYSWPGNVREIKNIVERLVITNMAPEPMQASLLGLLSSATDLQVHAGSFDYKEALASYERRLIEAALNEYGNTYKAAEALNLTQSTVSRKAKALGITKW